METIHPTDHTTITLYEVGIGIKADIEHNYGKYAFNDQIQENIGYHTLVIKSLNMAYAKRRARKYWSMYF